MVTDLSGAIAADSEQGVFASDTRLVSHYGICANCEPRICLASAVTASQRPNHADERWTFATEEGEIPWGTLALIISRAVSEGIHEDLDVINYGLVAGQFNLEITLRSDFASTRPWGAVTANGAPAASSFDAPSAGRSALHSS